MEKKVFTVTGMKCPKCKERVENAIKSLDGVENAVASVEEKNVAVDYDAQKVSPEAIKEAVDGLGHYDLEL